MKKALKYFGILLSVLLISLVGFFVYITLSDYQPEQIEVLQLRQSNQGVSIPTTNTFSITDWNIGYAGLGKDMDFFYDGGKRVRDSRQATEGNMLQITSFIKNNDSIDFWMIQEVDKKAKRSYGIDQVDEMEMALPHYFGVFATNYKVSFVPVPIAEPMGQVHAGMMTFSRFPISESVRYAYPLIADWPDRLFLLDRCFILNRYPLASGHDLCLINTHNSAYVFDSLLRVKELQILKKVMMEEYQKGNYVIAGGDWNQNPPGYEPEGGYNGHRFVRSQVQMTADLLPDTWQWIFDASAPTNRNNDQAYQKGVNGTTALDYYVVSPNVQLMDVKVIDLNFEHSDHNPIYLRFLLSDSVNANF